MNLLHSLFFVISKWWHWSGFLSSEKLLCPYRDFQKTNHLLSAAYDIQYLEQLSFINAVKACLNPQRWSERPYYTRLCYKHFSTASLTTKIWPFLALALPETTLIFTQIFFRISTYFLKEYSCKYFIWYAQQRNTSVIITF